MAAVTSASSSTAAAAAASDDVGLPASSSYHLLFLMLSPINVSVFLVAWLIPILGYTWWKHRHLKRRTRAQPLVMFFQELTSGASAGHDKKLFSLMHPSIFRRVERGTVRAMCRCIVDGQFLSYDPQSLQMTVRDATTSAVVQGHFTKAVGVTCQAAWMTNPATKTWQMIGFNVLPLHEGDFDVLAYVKPDEFTAFGERFVCALFAKSPSGAVEMMFPTLREKYATETAIANLAAEVGKVLRVCGGLRNKSEVDLTLVDSRVVRSGEEEGSKSNGIELEYAVLGAHRNMKISFKVVFTALKCSVIKYQIAAQPAHTNQRQVLIDPDNGTQTIIA